MTINIYYFHHFQKSWNRQEKSEVMGQLIRLKGTTREAYCELIGLTSEWVADCSKSELKVAVENLGMDWYASLINQVLF